MKTNVVAIDPSLSCTAMVVNDKRYAFVSRRVALTKKDELTKWFALSEPHVNYIFTNFVNLDDYSSNEINKLISYHETTKLICDIIHDNLDPALDVKIAMEGYSFSSDAGPLIDLVTFSTLLRQKLLDITLDVEIISPTGLKLEAAKLTYPAIQKGKKVIKYEYRNHEGMAGGSFKKHEMYKVLVDNTKIQSPWIDFLKTHQKEILNYKSIPKPIEDVNDAQILFYVTQNS
jgi:hypothetical protein